jgi:divalent metal cation (Fe/Co/Zn/Cd) transporter
MTMQLGPRQVLLTLDVVFRDGLTVAQLAAAIDRVESEIRKHHPQVREILIEAQALKRKA